MFVDDGAWSSKLQLKDKAQATLSDLAGIIKATTADAELPETLSETARQFATLESTIKSTRQNIFKLSLVLRQVQDTNFALLDNLQAADHASESLCLSLPSTP